MSPKTFVVDVDKCSGCGLCVIACKDEHVGTSYEPWTGSQPAVGHFWMNLLSYETGSTPKVSVSHLPLLCQHCANAPCIKACPENAIKRREDGLVWIDQDLCTGCGDCRPACPYGVIYMNDPGLGNPIAQKCTGCAHRVDEGLDPRCVDICPHTALLFGDAEDLVLQIEGLEIFHPEYNTRPLVFWKGLPKRKVSGMVIDRSTDDVVTDAIVTVTDLSYDETVEVTTDEFGDFKLGGLEEGRTYLITVGKRGYIGVQRVLGVDSGENLGEIGLSPQS